MDAFEDLASSLDDEPEGFEPPFPDVALVEAVEGALGVVAEEPGSVELAFGAFVTGVVPVLEDDGRTADGVARVAMLADEQPARANAQERASAVVAPMRDVARLQRR